MAFSLYKKAAQANHLPAILKLIECYQKDFSTKQNLGEAKHWMNNYTKLIEQSTPAAPSKQSGAAYASHHLRKRPAANIPIEDPSANSRLFSPKFKRQYGEERYPGNNNDLTELAESMGISIEQAAFGAGNKLLGSLKKRPSLNDAYCARSFFCKARIHPKFEYSSDIAIEDIDKIIEIPHQRTSPCLASGSKTSLLGRHSKSAVSAKQTLSDNDDEEDLHDTNHNQAPSPDGDYCWSSPSSSDSEDEKEENLGEVDDELDYGPMSPKRP